MADVGRIYSGNRAQANEEYYKRLLSRVYTREPMLQVLLHESGGAGKLRPDAVSIIGGGNIPLSRRKSLLGGYQNNIFWQTGAGATDQTENLTATDTVPEMTSPTTNSQAFLRKSAFFKWSKKMTEVLVWNVTVELAAGSFALGDAKLEAQNIGMQSHFDSFAQEVYVGNPADQTADLWSEQLGIYQACDDNNTYGGVDRSESANANFRGFTDGTTRAPSIDLKNTYEIALVNSYTQSVQDVSEGFDLIVWNRDAYLAVRAEANARGGILNMNSVPKHAESGQKMEGFYYDGVLNIYSPRLKDWSAVDSGLPDLSDAALFTKMQDWCFMTNPRGGSFKIGPWVSEGQYVSGGKDAQRMLITTMYQFWNEKAWSSLLATAVAG